MATNHQCDHAFKSVKIPTHIINSYGIPLTLRDTATESRCRHCNALENDDVTVPYPKRLMAAAALYRCTLPQRLNGAEMKFIRKAIGISAKDWAAHVSTDPSTLSRWESNSQAMSPAAEKLLRLTATINLLEEAPAVGANIKDIATLKLDGFADPDNFLDLSFVLIKYRKNELYSDLEEQAA